MVNSTQVNLTFAKNSAYVTGTFRGGQDSLGSISRPIRLLHLRSKPIKIQAKRVLPTPRIFYLVDEENRETRCPFPYDFHCTVWGLIAPAVWKTSSSSVIFVTQKPNDNFSLAFLLTFTQFFF